MRLRPAGVILLWLCATAVQPLTLVANVQAQVATPPLSQGVPPPRGDALTLPPGYRPFDAQDYVLTGVSVGIVAGKFLLGPLGERAGGVLWDDAARESLRANTEIRRRRARDISDIALTSLVSYPFFEAVVVAGWYRRSPDVAAEMALMDAEAMAVTAALQAIANAVAGRERPYGGECGNTKPALGRDCDSDDRFYSFFSGHTSQAFVSAALVCTHNAYLPLYGDGAGGLIACASTMAVAGVTGALRIVGDQHYLTDVATGAVLGTLVGLALPPLLHYDFATGGSERAGPASWGLQVVPGPTGIQAQGWFR